MPRNAVTKHILIIYLHVCLVSSITRCRRQSVIWTPRAEIHWHKLKKEVHRSSDTMQVAARESLESPLQLKRTKLGFADPYLRNLNFVCRCRMHIETIPFPKTDFQLPAEVAVTWQKRPPYLIGPYCLGVLGEFLSVTSQLIVQSRNHRGENAWVIGCIRRWAREVRRGGGRGYGWGLWRLSWKNCHKVSSKEQYFPIHVPRPIIMKDLYVYGDEWKALENYYKQEFSRNASEFSSYFYELVYKSGFKLWIKGFKLK